MNLLITLIFSGWIILDSGDCPRPAGYLPLLAKNPEPIIYCRYFGDGFEDPGEFFS